MDKKICTGEVIYNKLAGSNIFEMKIKSPYLASNSKMGQFVHLKTKDNTFLRRAISVADCDKEDGTITLMYRVVGSGTKALMGKKPKDVIDILGPLGNGFSKFGGKSLLIGGGVGIAPLIYLAKNIEKEDCIVLLGGKSKEEVFWDKYFLDFAEEIFITTDDGSKGKQGFAVSYLPQIIAKYKIDNIYVCGPDLMMKSIADFVKANNLKVNLEVSLESPMACGIGVCLGCTFLGKKSNRRFKICSDGPVFDGLEVY